MENNKIINKIICENKKYEILRKNPIFVVTWGQVGAGKSMLIPIIKKDFKNEKFIVIDSDEYRKYYPDLKNIIIEPATIAIKTGPFIRNIEKDLLLNYIKSKNNIIFVTSSKDYDEINELCNILKKYNYQIYLYGMLTSFSKAFIASQERYETQLKRQKEIPRFVDFNFYKKSFFGTRYTLKEIIKNNEIKQINMFERGATRDDLPKKIIYRDVYKYLNENDSLYDKSIINNLNALYEKRIARKAPKVEIDVLDEFKNYINCIMDRQFKNYQTFFDIGIEPYRADKFTTLCCTISNVKKKRSYRNRAVLKYLKGKQLTEEEKELCDSVLSGRIYQKDKEKTEHCELCQEDLNIANISRKYIYWDVEIPSRPYYPGSVMLVLKERKQKKTENIQDLSEQEFEELKRIIKDLYNIVKNHINKYKIIGVNVLFNQISKSQLCIHGHVEFMIAEAHEQHIGYHLKNVRKFDKLTELINSEINSNKILKVKEGIKIDLENTNYKIVKNILTKYDYLIKKHVEIAKKVKDNNIATNSLENLYIHNLTPAPVNYIYITYYRNRFLLSSIPEILLDRADIELLDENNEYDLYTMKVNQYAKEKQDLLLEHESPFIRPSTKIEKRSSDYEATKIFDYEIEKLMNNI